MFAAQTALRKSWAVAVVAGLTLAGSLRADPPRGDNLLERTRQTNIILGQRLETDIRGAIQQAERQAATQPDKAVEKLKAALTRLEDDTALPQERRAALKRILQKRIESIKSGTDVRALDEKQMQATIRRVENRKDAEDRAAEGETLRKGMKQVLELQKNGKLADARKLAEELAARYPAQPAAQNLFRTATAFDQLASARQIRREKADRMTRVYQDIARSSMPPKDDIEFPKDWKERAKNRAPFGVKLTAQEKAILRSLHTPLTVNFKDDRFQDVMEYLSTALGQPILLTKADLTDASVSYDTPVTLAAKNVTARTLLRKILGEFGLTYVIKDGAIQVVSALKARDMMVTRAYYVGDLMGVHGGPGDPWTYVFGPGLAQVQTIQSIAGIIEMVQTSVDPQSWQANGGSGSVFFHYPTMSLVVKQSAEVHGMIANSLLP